MDKGKRKKVWAWVLLGLGIVYDLSPLDVIPDVPVVGWIDDFFVTVAVVLNLLQQNSDGKRNRVAKVAKWLKWGVIAIGILSLFVVMLLFVRCGNN